MSAPSCRRGFASAFALSFALLLGGLTAQTITVGSSGSLNVGQSTSVSFHDPARANQTVVITITSNWPNVVTESHVVTLNAEGHGSFTWTVPKWTKAYFNGPGAKEVSVAIM